MEKTIIEQLLWNGDYFTRVWPYLSEDTFKNGDVGYLVLYRLIKDHYEQYKDVPSLNALKIALDAAPVRQAEYDLSLKIYNELKLGVEEDSKWLLDSTEEFVRNNAIFNATSESMLIQENARKPKDQQRKNIPGIGAIPDLLKDAISISFDNEVGHDWYEDYEERWKAYQENVDKIPFGISILDDVTNEGIERKTLNVILAGVNVGKSLGLVALTSAYMTLGYNVLYVSLEMAEKVVAARVDAALLGIDLDDLNNKVVPFQDFSSKIKQLRNKTKLGKLKIKQYPTGGASAITVKSLLQELKMKADFVPDIIMVDYIGIAASYRLKTYTENSYTQVKAVAEEFRGLAIEENVAIWTGAQTTRGAWGSGDIEMGDTAESAGLPAVADFMIGLIETEETAREGIQLVKQLKSRYGDKNKRLRFALAVNKQRQTWNDVETSKGDQILMDAGLNPSGPINQSTSQASKGDIKKLAQSIKFG